MSGGFRSRSRRPSQRNERGGKIQKDRRSPANREKAVKAQMRMRSLGVDPARATAYEVIAKVHKEDSYANLILPSLLKERRISGRDAAFATELTYGTLRAEGTLDAIIEHCSSRPLKDIDQAVKDALRLGVYQLLYTRVDAHAAVDTSVTIAGAVLNAGVRGFVNAILREVSQHPLSWWMNALQPQDRIDQLALEFNHPRWIVESFSRSLPEEEWEEALAADSARPRVHLVARPGEISAEELALISGGEMGEYSPYAVYFPGGNPGSLEAVREGMASVQDEGSQLIPRALTLAPLIGEDQGRWLDLCAGPGGKAALLGALARIDGAHVDAVEVSEHRADLVRTSVRDLPVTVHTADGRHSNLSPGYDRILVDAPCSGLGSLRRRPEARWRKKESDIKELTVLQQELLLSAIRLLRPGGVVVYSTCSPDLRETRRVIDAVCAKADVSELDTRALVPENLPDTGSYSSVQLWPHRHGTDAMFFVTLLKN